MIIYLLLTSIYRWILLSFSIKFEYFDKKTEKAKKDIAKMLQQKQAEAAKKQAEGGKHEQSEK